MTATIVMPSVVRSLVLFIIGATCVATSREGSRLGTRAHMGRVGIRARRMGVNGFVQALKFNYRLRVCNAYPCQAALSISRGPDDLLTGESPMPYKSCRDFTAPLHAGDELEFMVGDASAGIFAVSELPDNDAILLIVIHRHDTLSSAVSFESQVFSKLVNAQIAVIDTYKGATQGHLGIMDATDEEGPASGAKGDRSEELRFDSVVAVNPGRYEVVLDSPDGAMKAKSSLVALNRESYVVLRVGVEGEDGQVFPQELMVYPHSSLTQLRGAGLIAHLSFPAALTVFIAAAFSFSHA